MLHQKIAGQRLLNQHREEILEYCHWFNSFLTECALLGIDFDNLSSLSYVIFDGEGQGFMVGINTAGKLTINHQKNQIIQTLLGDVFRESPFYFNLRPEEVEVVYGRLDKAVEQVCSNIGLGDRFRNFSKPYLAALGEPPSEDSQPKKRRLIITKRDWEDYEARLASDDPMAWLAGFGKSEDLAIADYIKNHKGLFNLEIEYRER